MRIVFVSSLANNGGSRTIILSSKTLNQLGHPTDILIRGEDAFTWFPHKRRIYKMPEDIDAILATNCSSVPFVKKTNVPKKAWYIRGHETWACEKSKLLSFYKDYSILNIVNSKGLQNFLQLKGVNSVVVYQGIDFHWWKSENKRKSKIRIGALHTNQPSKRWKDFVKLAKILGTKNYEFVGMGSSCPKHCNFLTKFKVNATVNDLNGLYNSCHIWFAPTNSEGLHNVPMEAALCGCLIVCSNSPLNGMIFDYAFDKKTAMVYENLDQAVQMIKEPDWSLVENMQRHLKEEIGDRETNMRKLVCHLQNIKQIKLL